MQEAIQHPARTTGSGKQASNEAFVGDRLHVRALRPEITANRLIAKDWTQSRHAAAPRLTDDSQQGHGHKNRVAPHPNRAFWNWLRCAAPLTTAAGRSTAEGCPQPVGTRCLAVQ